MEKNLREMIKLAQSKNIPVVLLGVPRPGLFLSSADVYQRIADDADIVFTGEGRIDHQTAHGKTPMGVAKVAKQFNLPVIALAGCVGDNYQAVYQCGIDAVFPCVPRAMSLADAMTEAETNVANLAENVARLWTKK